MLRRYWTTARQGCSLKPQCTTGLERRISWWEHEHLLEAVQARLDAKPQHAPAPGNGRASVWHHQSSHGSDALPDEDAAEGHSGDGLAVLAYNLTRAMNIVGIKSLIAPIAA
jgi:hypothetical protein